MTCASWKLGTGASICINLDQETFRCSVGRRNNSPLYWPDILWMEWIMFCLPCLLSSPTLALRLFAETIENRLMACSWILNSVRFESVMLLPLSWDVWGLSVAVADLGSPNIQLTTSIVCHHLLFLYIQPQAIGLCTSITIISCFQTCTGLCSVRVRRSRVSLDFIHLSSFTTSEVGGLMT